MKTGDSVRHRPSGETWTVAYVEDGRLAWCGWPPGLAKVEDCELVEECSSEESQRLVRALAAMSEGDDGRRLWALRQLEASAARAQAPKEKEIV